MVIGVGDLRKGLTIELDGQPYQVVEHTTHKMQQRAPVVKLKLRDLKTGRTIEKSYNGYDVKLNRATVEQRAAQYIYQDADLYYFMDVDNFEQFPLNDEQLGEGINYLVDQMELQIVFFKDVPISVQLPTFVELKVVDTPPGVKGDTAAGATKPAVLETGLTVNVPFFVNNGEAIRVDTRTGQYLERAG